MPKFKRLMSKKFERILPYSTIEELWHMYEDFEDFACAIEQAVLQSPEIQGMIDALNQCRVALEPYDDVKPRDWKTDRENLRYAHQVVCAAIATMEKQT